MEVECRKHVDLGDGCTLVWNVYTGGKYIESGLEKVYFEYDGQEIEEDDILIETTNYRKAEKVFDNTKAYMEA